MAQKNAVSQFRQSSDILCCGVSPKLLESLPRLENYQELVYAVGPWLWACEVGILGPLPLRGPYCIFFSVMRGTNHKW